MTRPEYRTDLPPAGSRYFQCAPLRAVLNTKSCAERWQAAAQGSTCHKCGVGRMHADDHAPAKKRPGRRPVDNEVRACTRCGRSDLRIVKKDAVCVSCFNRQREWVKGRNGRGTPPARFTPLHPVEVAVQHQDGTTELRLIEARDAAEAVSRIGHDLREGSRIIDTPRPGPTVWNPRVKDFEYQCRHCRQVGLILERKRSNNVLEHWRWCCQGDPSGGGWQPAVVRQPIFAMGVDAMSAVLNGDPELTDEAPCEWTPTAHPCSCRAGQVEAQLLAPGGRWRTRCRACGADSE